MAITFNNFDAATPTIPIPSVVREGDHIVIRSQATTDATEGSVDFLNVLDNTNSVEHVNVNVDTADDVTYALNTPATGDVQVAGLTSLANVIDLEIRAF